MQPKEIAKTLNDEFINDCKALDKDEPWFGHITLDLEGVKKSFKIARGNLFRMLENPEKYRIIAYHHPIAGIYHSCKDGENMPGEEIELEYELNVPAFENKKLILDSRSVLHEVDHREIKRIEIGLPDGSHMLEAHNGGFKDEAEVSVVQPKIPEHTGLLDISHLLTSEQYRLVTSRTDKPLFVQGCAGSGKTTVGLMRLDYLLQQDENGKTGYNYFKNAQIIMFNKPLCDFIKKVVQDLNLPVKPDTFDAWALNLANRVCGGGIVPQTKKQEYGSAAGNFKKEEQMLRVVDAFVEKQENRMVDWLKEKLRPLFEAQPDVMGWVNRLQEMSGPVVKRLKTLCEEARKAANVESGSTRTVNEAVYDLFNKAVERMTLFHEDLLKMFTDTDLLQQYAGVKKEKAEKLAQFQTTLQKDNQAAEKIGKKLTFEDLPIILRLAQVKNGGIPAQDNPDETELIDYLMVDEIQDFGAVQLKVLFSMLKDKNMLTAVGDLDQKIYPQNHFIGWSALLSELDADDDAIIRLQVGHRSTLPILRLAATIQDIKADRGREGDLPELIKVASDDEAIKSLASIIEKRLKEEENAHICVISNLAAKSTEIYDRLTDLFEKEGKDRFCQKDFIRLGRGNNFKFKSGVTITSLHLVKGLEFDTVILMDPTQKVFPDNKNGQRQLYTVVTRAQEKLFFILNDKNEITPLLGAAMKAGLFCNKVEESSNVPKIKFDSSDEGAF